VPFITDDTTLEAALPALLAALPAALAALLAAVPAALAALLAALPAALAADDPALEALEARSLVASLVAEQLTANAAAMARPPAAAAARAIVVVISLLLLLWIRRHATHPPQDHLARTNRSVTFQLRIQQVWR
jgi:hypothetical protein